MQCPATDISLKLLKIKDIKKLTKKVRGRIMKSREKALLLPPVMN
jgi:hypothetical protein